MDMCAYIFVVWFLGGWPPYGLVRVSRSKVHAEYGTLHWGGLKSATMILTAALLCQGLLFSFLA